MTGHGTPAGATTLMAQVLASSLDAPILDPSDMRWDRLLYSCPSVFDLRDRFRGALVGGAIGDAMGRPNEGARSSESRARRIREYQPWQGYRSGPKGTITDDTQMTMWLAESILAAAQRRRGSIGEAGSEHAEARGGIGETGNRRSGADLRDRLIDPEDLAKRFTLVFARWASKNQRDFPCAFQRWFLRTRAKTRYNGAYVLESLPCALWCFLASPEEFEQTLFAAVDAGHDADTVAAMACSVAGAYRGYSRLSQRFLDDLEYRDHLVELADNLVGLHRRCYGAS